MTEHSRESPGLGGVAPAAVEEERAFFDEEYRRCLHYPEEWLTWNATRLRQALADPSHPFWERRRLYAAALDALQAERLDGREVLDYGCGTGDWGVLIAGLGARVTLLDLSPVAVEVGLRRARASGVGDRVSGIARSAADLSCFADGAFDLAFACAALHHTVKYPGALAELVRVIRPGGTLLLVETLGNNAILNRLRRLRARFAHEPPEQGEGKVLADEDLAHLRRHFATVEVRPVNLLAMAKRLFRGHYRSPLVRAGIATLELADRVLLSLAPALLRFCGEAVVVARR